MDKTWISLTDIAQIVGVDRTTPRKNITRNSSLYIGHIEQFEDELYLSPKGQALFLLRLNPNAIKERRSREKVILLQKRIMENFNADIDLINVDLYQAPITQPHYFKIEGVDEVVYFAQNKENGLVKIGRTKNLPGRISQFKTVSPLTELLFSIKTNDAYRTERRLHGLFDFCRVYGEWFKFANGMSPLFIQPYLRGDEICQVI